MNFQLIGLMTFADGAVSNVLMEARLPIVAMAKCQQSYRNIAGSRIDDSVLCAGNLSGGLDSCQVGNVQPN